MKAVITGASSGIGKDMAFELAKRGYDLILVARRKEKLLEIKEQLNVDVQVIALDLSKKENCYYLFSTLKDQKDINVVINNAGFGYLGEFKSMKADKIESMIDLNVTCLTILFNLFLGEFIKRNRGYILNVASASVYTFGPLMSEYYATKSYVYQLTRSVSEELRQNKSKVKVSVLCPGPVKTEFDEVANANNCGSVYKSEYIAKTAINKILKGKTVIIPGIKIKFRKFFARFICEKALLRIGYLFQKKKIHS